MDLPRKRTVAAVALTVALITAAAPIAPITPASAATGPENCEPNPRATAADADLSAGVSYLTGNRVQLTYHPDADDRNLSVDLRGHTEVLSTTGFTNQSGTYVWDGETEDPRITYHGISVSSDDWGAGTFLTPEHGNATVHLNPDQGAVSRELMFLGGAYHTYNYSNGCEDIRMIVPCGVVVDPTAPDVMDSVRYASENLDVGNRWDTATVFAVEDVRSFGVLGVYFGEGDMAVRASSDVESAGNTWVHEYVHSRQAATGNYTRNMSWFTEASAEYYAARMALESGEIDSEDYNSHLTDAADSDSILSQPNTWAPMADYEKGSLVLGRLDQKIRAESGGDHSLETVLREVNNRAASDGNVTYSEFRAIVAEQGGPESADLADKYVTTDAYPGDYHLEHQDPGPLESALAWKDDWLDEVGERIDSILDPGEGCSRTGLFF